MKIRHTSLTYERAFNNGFTNTVTLANRKIDPHFSFRYTRDFDGNNDPIKTDTVMNESTIALTARFAYREKFLKGKFQRVSLGSDYPILSLTYTLGLKGVLGSDYNYNRLDFNLFDWFYANPVGWVSYRIKAGKIFGELPFPLLHVHPGNETYFYNIFSFNNMNEYEFISDTYVTLFITHHFDGFIFNRIPLLRLLKLRFLTDAKITYGWLSENNRRNNTDELNFQGNWELTAPKPYVEVSAGIENILSLFRIDLVRRLTYLDKPNAPKWGLRAGMQLMF